MEFFYRDLSKPCSRYTIIMSRENMIDKSHLSQDILLRLNEPIYTDQIYIRGYY